MREETGSFGGREGRGGKKEGAEGKEEGGGFEGGEGRDKMKETPRRKREEGGSLGEEQRRGRRPGKGRGGRGGDAAYLATCISRFLLPPDRIVMFLFLVGKRLIKRCVCVASMLFMQPLASCVHEDLNK